MATWGQYFVGSRSPITREETVVAGKVYEARYRTLIDLPDNLELPLIRKFIKYREHGAEPTYVYCKRRTVMVQWYQRTASPVSAGVIILGLLTLAIVVLAIALTLVSISRVDPMFPFGIPTSLIMAGFGFLIIIIVLVLVVLPVIRKPPERRG